MGEERHQPRELASGSPNFAPILDPGPMGLRCLHPWSPEIQGLVIVSEKLQSEIVLAYRHPDHFLEDYKSCAFDGCVCRCHGATA